MRGLFVILALFSSLAFSQTLSDIYSDYTKAEEFLKTDSFEKTSDYKLTEQESSRIAEEVQDAIVLLEGKDSFGTGFFVSENLIVTNEHFTKDAYMDNVQAGFRYVHVENSDKILSIGEVILEDVGSDLALIKIQGKHKKYLRLSDEPASSYLKNKQAAFVSGYPGRNFEVFKLKYISTNSLTKSFFPIFSYAANTTILNSLKLRHENQEPTDILSYFPETSDEFYKTYNSFVGCTLCGFSTKGASGSPILNEDLEVIGVFGRGVRFKIPSKEQDNTVSLAVFMSLKNHLLKAVIEHGGRSSGGRAPDCGSGCRGFKSRRSPQ